jgi:hypothetical protein
MFHDLFIFNHFKQQHLTFPLKAFEDIAALGERFFKKDTNLRKM